MPFACDCLSVPLSPLQAHFLPLALLSALLLGVSWPSLGMAAADLQIPTITTFGIFIIQVKPAGTRACV